MATASPEAAANSGGIFLYFGPLTLLIYLALPHAYLLDFATAFMLKNQLHASATEVSIFRLVTAVPVYLSVFFGLARDSWNPFGLRDRGYFLIFGGASAVVFVWMAFSGLSYNGLFVGMLLVMVTFRFVSAAYQGLMALVGQEQLMSGRLSALWQIVSFVPYVIGAFGSGFVAANLTPKDTFILVAILSALIAAFGFLKPRAVFNHAYDRPPAKGTTFFGDIKRLFSHRAIYPAILVMFMFQFAPGSNTPLQYYLTNDLHASDAIYGYFYGVFTVSFIPVFFLYGYLCKKVRFEKLMWWGMVITVPQMIPLAFIHSANMALLLAAPMGLMGGMAGVVIYDLAIRACPPGLQGTLMMMIEGVYQLSARGGDILGSQIYASSPAHGFQYCVIATTLVYALILPVLLWVPKEIAATADGESNPALDALPLAETGSAG